MSLKSHQKQIDNIDSIKAMEPLQAYEAGQSSVDESGAFVIGFVLGVASLVLFLLFALKGTCR